MFEWDPQKERLNFSKHGVSYVLHTEAKKFGSLVPDFGERVKKDMKKKIKYTDEPIKLGRRVDDFLPSPAEIALSQKNQRVTINLNEASLSVFKKEAKRLGVPYQKLLRTVVDLYAKKYLIA